MSLPASEMPEVDCRPVRGDVAPLNGEAGAARKSLTVLILVPALEGGAADAGAVELARVLCAAGHRAIVLSRAGRLVAEVTAAGAEFVPLDVGSNNPAVMLRNAAVLIRLARERKVDAIHALGRTAAWSAYIAARVRGVPFITGWYKGFREQNLFKRLYNRIMARGDRVVAVSEQIAQLIHDRYGTPWERIAVVPMSVDLERFDPAAVSRERIDEVRRGWGVTRDTKVILVSGRILRRKGHHVVVKAVRRLKDMGFKDFLCVFCGEDRGRTHYTGELWDLVLATDTMDVIRIAPVADLPAAYAAAAAVVSAAVQPEGLQRAILEAQAMARPVIVSDMAAGPDVVLTPPAVPEGRISGLRFPAGDDAALAGALLRLFSMPEPSRRAIGARGRDWVLGHFDAASVAARALELYDDALGLAAPPTQPQEKTGI
jgi:glycosyltransferase involved in cell wall biosynthesis